MQRQTWQPAILVAALIVQGPLNRTALSASAPPCDHAWGTPHHGELSKPIEDYSYAEFYNLVTKELTWEDTRGADNAPRRADCGHECLYKRGANDKNERDDDPPKVLASIHPICDASDIALDSLPEHGVLIGRVAYEGTFGPEPKGPLKRLGDASINIGGGKFNGKHAREREHYVFLTRGPFVLPKHHAVWKLVALRKDANERAGDLVVVDEGLFSVCLPEHGTPGNREPLASFRSCAEVHELRFLSALRPIQQAVLGDSAIDSVTAERTTFSLLVRADSTALVRLRARMSTLFPGLPQSQRDQEESDTAPRSQGPFMAATSSLKMSTRRLVTGRYADLHPDAPMWFVCAGGCCSGTPW
jgi:hypothetical protein